MTIESVMYVVSLCVPDGAWVPIIPYCIETTLECYSGDNKKKIKSCYDKLVEGKIK